MISILDFEDSFTFNIASEIKLASLELGLPSSIGIEVVKFENHLSFLESVCESQKKRLIVLGPGPGHPDKHRELSHLLSLIMKNENLFLLGICLGHQIIGEIAGFQIDKCETPVHGEAREYDIPEEVTSILDFESPIIAQSYNSLAVIESKNSHQFPWIQINLKQNNEVFLFLGQRILSYQFHPESVGTNYRSRFFRYPLSFLI